MGGQTAAGKEQTTETTSVSTANFDWILPNRLAQGAFPGRTVAVFNAWDVVVYCAEELQPKFSVMPNGKYVYYMPMDDDIYRPVPPRDVQKLWPLAGKVADHARRGHRCLVTCAMGANRSGLLMGLTLMRLNGMSGSAAVDLIKARRRSGQQEALSNPMFEQFLRASLVHRQ